jgi:hypothetical protein
MIHSGRWGAWLLRCVHPCADSFRWAVRIAWLCTRSLVLQLCLYCFGFVDFSGFTVHPILGVWLASSAAECLRASVTRAACIAPRDDNRSLAALPLLE